MAETTKTDASTLTKTKTETSSSTTSNTDAGSKTETKKSVEIWCPQPFGEIPGMGDRDISTWVVFEGFAIGKMTTDIKITPDSTQERNYTLGFAIAREFMETLTHTWQSYESIQSKATELYARLTEQTWEQVKSIKPAATAAVKSLSTAGSGGLKDTTKKAIGSAINTSSDVNMYRVDTPLQYKNSERRMWEFMFHLTTIKNRYDDVVYPVRVLQYLSSPSRPKKESDDPTKNSAITPPFIFKVYTLPEGFLSVERAIITQVNPVFRGPWIDGYPTYCELRLTVQEWDPLFGDVWNKSNVLSVKMDGGETK